MRTEYEPALKATVTRDNAGHIREIYFDKLHEMGNLRGPEAAEKFIRDTFGGGIAPDTLRNIGQRVSHSGPCQQAIEYRLSGEKTFFDTTTYIYDQTLCNTPIWNGGITVTIKHAGNGGSGPARVVAATDTSVDGVEVKLPSPEALERYRRLFAAAEKAEDGSTRPHAADLPGSELLRDILGDAGKVGKAFDGSQVTPQLIRGRFFIYRYDPKERTHQDSLKLPLQVLPESIHEGSASLVAELVFRLPYQGEPMNWRILVDVETNAILLVRGLSAGIAGFVFPYDPVTSSGDATHSALATNGVLNNHRELKELYGLVASDPQSLVGKFACVVDNTPPAFQPPTRPANSNFDIWFARTNEFAAVNAYYHVDRFFRLVEELGFQVDGPGGYFAGTSFPISVDHRGFSPPQPHGNVVNARVIGSDYGVDTVFYALAHFGGGFVSKIRVTNCGRNYTSPPTVSFSGGGGGSGAGATAHIQNGEVTAVTVNPGAAGSGYMAAPLIKFNGGGGNGAWATAEIDVSDPIGIATDWRVTLHELGGHATLWSHIGDGHFKFAHSAGDCFTMILNDYLSAWHDRIPERYLLLPFVPGVNRRCDRSVDEQSLARVNVTQHGSGYLSVSLSGGGVREAKAEGVVSGGGVTQVTMMDRGAGYTDTPLVNFSGGGGTGAAGIAQIALGEVVGVTVTSSGSGYTSKPKVNFLGGGPAKAAISSIVGGVIARLIVIDPGMGYQTAPTVQFSGSAGSGAEARAEIDGLGRLIAVDVTAGGTGYSLPRVSLSPVGEQVSGGASIKPEDIVDGYITKIFVTEPGKGYPTQPNVTIDPPTGGVGTAAQGVAVTGAWGWGDAMDIGNDGRFGSGYQSEQILATTMFRAYQAIGGDAQSLDRRKFAAHYMAYLLLRAIGQLSKNRNPETAGAFLRELQAADKGDWTTKGVVGGAYGKVLAWAFEKQKLNDARPSGVDVYIDDSRADQYDYVENYWATTAIWNRRTPDGIEAHQEPVPGQPNFAYVKVKNKGPLVANDIVVKGYHCKPSAGLLWPDDLQPMTTSEVAAGTIQPNAGKTVGPFEWTPVVNGFGHDSMLMIASATGDLSNVEHMAPGTVIEDWRLVPNDNNIALRNVVLVSGAGGTEGLVTALHGKGLWIRNPGLDPATIAMSVKLPPLLERCNWSIGHDLGAEGRAFSAREQLFVTYDVRVGEPFTRADIEAESERDIVVTVTVNGAVIGGMTYTLDAAP